MTHKYTYKILTSPEENEINELGEQGWRVVGFAAYKTEYGGSRTKVLLERVRSTFDPDTGRL